MRDRSLLLDEPAPPINSETLAEVKKEDMKEAVGERFRGRIKNRPAARSIMLDQPAPPINADTLAQVKKEDMKEAVGERFRGRIKNRAAARQAKGAPESQPTADKK